MDVHASLFVEYCAFVRMLSWTQTPAKWAMTPNTTVTTQTVLCKAPYCLALSMYNMKAYLLHIATPASVWLKFSLSAMFTLLPPLNLDCHLHMLAIPLLCSNTAEFTSIIINLCSVLWWVCQDYKFKSWVENMLIEKKEWTGIGGQYVLLC